MGRRDNLSAVRELKSPLPPMFRGKAPVFPVRPKSCQNCVKASSFQPYNEQKT